MNQIFRYLKIYLIVIKSRFIHEFEYRVNLMMGMVGSFVFVFLNYFVIYFFVKKFTFLNWDAGRLWLLLGCFMITYYLVYYLYYRGIINLIRNINTGKLDHFLLKPIDYQFSVLTYGGGMHNLLATTAGVVLFTKAFIVGGQGGVANYLISILLCFIGAFNFYGFLLLLTSLNFRYGYIDEVLSLAFSFQDVSKYPLDAYLHLPIYFLIFTIPFSALTTIPAMVAASPSFPLLLVLLFLLFSVVFSYLSRRVFLKAIRSYSSGS